ncbi:MAG: hypothetical protein R3326_09965 [Gemmatimonadota bacterium]|nr:hypothetical protein [Gemmatimonadota bacterium]
MPIYRKTAWIAPLLVGALFACGSEVEPPEPTARTIPSDSFRAVIVELAVDRIEVLPDTQAWNRRRRAILDRHGLSPADLRGFVDAYARNDEVMESIYRDLDTTLDSIAESRPPGEGADRFPSAEDAARAAARAGEAVDTTGFADTLEAGEAVPGTTPPVASEPGDTIP